LKRKRSFAELALSEGERLRMTVEGKKNGRLPARIRIELVFERVTALPAWQKAPA
jgi:hypothetical protein